MAAAGHPNGGHGAPSTTYTNGIGHPTRTENPFKNVPAFTPSKKLRVVTIGAGYSGLTLAHKLRYQHPEMEHVIDHVIFEARNDIGGTWLVNTYPGVICDVPSHIYVRRKPLDMGGEQWLTVSV